MNKLTGQRQNLLQTEASASADQGVLSVTTGDANKVQPGKKPLLLTIIRAALIRLRLSGWDSTLRNCFFDREEQRKFELITEAKRHWPNQLIDTSFKYRGDV